jgi:hypothetical protein
MVVVATGIWSVNCAFLILGEHVFLLPLPTSWNTILGVSRVKKNRFFSIRGIPYLPSNRPANDGTIPLVPARRFTSSLPKSP